MRRGSVTDLFFVPAIVLATFVAVVAAMSLFAEGAEYLSTALLSHGTITWEDAEGRTHTYDAPAEFRASITVWDYFVVALFLGIYGAFVFALSRLPVVKESLPIWLLIGLFSLYFVHTVHSGITTQVAGISEQNSGVAVALEHMPLTTAVIENLPYIHMVFWVAGTILFYAKGRFARRVGAGGGGMSW